jgi:hypothetical protein
MVDLDNVTNFNRTEAEAQEFLLCAIVVAGKKGKTQALKLELFLNVHPEIKDNSCTPFEYVSKLIQYELLMDSLKSAKLGQYERLYNCFTALTRYKALNVTIDELEAIKGIGMKTSRFFLTHSRESSRYAILDTHILAFMREELGYKTPKSTPQSPSVYKEIEEAYLAYADSTGKSLADVDLEIWRSRRHDI